MKIGPEKSAKVSYQLSLVKTGEQIEKTSDDKPALFKFGVGQLIKGFEENLDGLAAGDPFDFVIKAEEAYGETDPYAIFDIPIDTFKVDGKVDEKMLQVGNKIPMTDDQGNKHLGKITKLGKESVTMDFNHPLAGQDLRFTGNILEVFQDE